MGDDQDNIIDISFDDDEARQPAADEVLEIDLEPDEAVPPYAPSAPPRGQQQHSTTPDGQDDDSGDLPMTVGGVCPRCGYALRPLEEKCPRCARLGSASAAPADESADAGPLPAAEGLPEAPRSKGCLIGGIIGGICLLGLVVGVPLAIWFQPAQQAKREYRLGLQAQLQADFETARRHYLKALEFDPNMGLAAFSMGTTYLGVGDPALVQAMQAITERASRGETRELEAADEWFRKTLEIGWRLPPSQRLMDQRIQTPAHLRAFAHASLALTAFIRAAAALNADALEDAMAWMQVAQQEAQAALVDDPENAAAQQMLRSTEGMIPPPSGLD